VRDRLHQLLREELDRCDADFIHMLDPAGTGK